MDSNYSNSVVLITGGTGLLGKEIVRGFLRKKCQVYFTSTSELKIDKLIKSLESKEKKNCFPIFQKFENIEDIKLFVKKYYDINFNILVNNARDISNLKFDLNSYDQIENFNKEIFLAVTLPYFLTTKLKKKSIKSIINISSMYGVVAPNKNLYIDKYKSSPIFYGISKAAQIHLTKELAVRLSHENIRINSVSYGGVEGRVNSQFKKRYSSMCPIGRMLKKDEVFEPIWFLASEQSSGATGHNLVIDGGWTIW
jgi:NAD(P)-dependent dehydrogenase (short-subunit alcohol dehydrogenase family)